MGKNDDVDALLQEVKHAPGTITTGIDRLYTLVSESGTLRVKSIAARLGIPQQLALQWSRVLAERGLVRLHYPLMGGIEVRKA